MFGGFTYGCDRDGCDETEFRPIDFVAGDVSSDNTTNVRDAALVLQYLAGWNVTLG